MMSADEAKEAIAEQVQVTRADIVAAKNRLLNRGTGPLTIRDEANAWVSIAVPGSPSTLRLDADDTADQFARAARAISVRLAVGAAAWDLVSFGIALMTGGPVNEDMTWGYTDRGYSSSFGWGERFPNVYPSQILRPAWRDTPSELFDADLYLQRLQPALLHPEVERALRTSLECFRRELWLPCVAMLGVAHEGAWLEMGERLAACFAGDPGATSLATTLANRNASTWAKVDGVCHYYGQAVCQSVRQKAAIKPPRLRQTQQWSDQVRESRNVLHWNVVPSVPNTYEKVAVLLMAATSELGVLLRVRDAC